MRRYKLREFDAAAEQFLPGESNPLPRGVTQLGDDCWYLHAQESWLKWPYAFNSQKIDPGDWIIRTNRGEIYRMSDEDFYVTYEAHVQD